VDARVVPAVAAAPAAEAPPHFDGRRFFQPGVRTLHGPTDVWRWLREGDRRPWPASVPIRHHAPRPECLPAGAIGLTLIGHSTVLIRAGGLNCLTDPVFSPCAGPAGRLGPRRVRPPAIALSELPQIDLVLLSHDHYDHLDLPGLQWLGRHHRPAIVCGLGHRQLLGNAGIDKVFELDWWQAWTGPAGTSVHFVPAQHWCGRGLHDRNLRLWGGLYLRTAAGSVYFAGDTGYAGHFAEIRRHLGAPDIALLPIGAYAPRWFMSVNHMNPAEAVAAHRDLGARLSIPVHYGTFRLSGEGIDEPLVELDRARSAAGAPPEQLRVLDFGESMVFSPRADLPAAATAG